MVNSVQKMDLKYDLFGPEKPGNDLEFGKLKSLDTLNKLTDSSQIWYASIFVQYLGIAANKSKMCWHF